MKFNILFARLGTIAIIAAVALLMSCEKDVYSPADESSSSGTLSDAGFNKGHGKGKGKHSDDPIPDPTPDPFVVTYELDQAGDFDPLFKFSISQSGQLMLLETDPTVATWGTDYWGYWSDPFSYTNNEVNYIIGLTNTTYQFQPLPGNKMDVTKILVVQPYPSGTPTTTVSHPGVYSLSN